jgi:hypothetical protein
MHPKYKKLNEALVELLDEYKMVSYCYLNPQDEETLETVAMRVNDQIQYFDSLEVNDKGMERAEEARQQREEDQMDMDMAEQMGGVGMGF